MILQRPPSSSLSYTGQGNDDARSPGSGGTPGPLSQPPNSQLSVDNGSEAGKKRIFFGNPLRMLGMSLTRGNDLIKAMAEEFGGGFAGNGSNGST